MKIGDKVFVVTGWSESDRVHLEGSISSLVNGGYVHVRVSAEQPKAGPYMVGGHVLRDTPHNRRLWEEHVTAMKVWRKSEPNVFSAMNRRDQ